MPPLVSFELGDDAGLYGAVSTALAEAEPLLYRGGDPNAQVIGAVNATKRP